MPMKRQSSCRRASATESLASARRETHLAGARGRSWLAPSQRKGLPRPPSAATASVASVAPLTSPVLPPPPSPQASHEPPPEGHEKSARPASLAPNAPGAQSAQCGEQVLRAQAWQLPFGPHPLQLSRRFRSPSLRTLHATFHAREVRSRVSRQSTSNSTHRRQATLEDLPRTTRQGDVARLAAVSRYLRDVHTWPRLHLYATWDCGCAETGTR